jgi:hypothetical protein
MKLDAAAIVLRPRGVAEVFDLACRFCSVHAGVYLRLGAAVLLPGHALCLALHHALDWGWGATWLAAAALATVAQGAFTVLVSRLLFAEALSARAALAAFGRRLGPYLGALLVSRFLLAAACLPAFLGLPFAWPPLLFQHEATLLEGAGPLASVSRSSRFVKGRGGVAFQALLLLLLAQAAFVGAAELFGDGLTDGILQIGNPFGSLLEDGGTPFALLGFFASVPYVATARFLQYIDLRTRADGWDVQVRFLALAAREPEPAPHAGPARPARGPSPKRAA